MLLAIFSVLFGLGLLVWSADRFVHGASESARHFGVSPLLIGMVIIGFGTSAPEIMVSAMAASDGNTGLALGNAYGSNIVNIALILGITAFMMPLIVRSSALRSEIPILIAITGLAAWQLWDNHLSRLDAIVLIVVFFMVMAWTTYKSREHNHDALGDEVIQELADDQMSRGKAITLMLVGLVLLIASSRMLVWGAVEIAHSLGISDLIIGLTIVAVGTSLPELASSIAAARKGEDDLAVGNILGSNLFNTMAVVGIAGLINPMQTPSELLSRDLLLVGILTVLLFAFGFSRHSDGRLGRKEGLVFLAIYIGYTGYLIQQTVLSQSGT